MRMRKKNVLFLHSHNNLKSLSHLEIVMKEFPELSFHFEQLEYVLNIL